MNRIWTSFLAVMLAVVCVFNIQIGSAVASNNIKLADASKSEIIGHVVDKALDKLGPAYKIAVKDDNAVVYNATQEQVEFKTYNDTDQLRWVPAREGTINPGYTSLLDKGPTGYGPTIQVEMSANNQKEGPFYIKRCNAYIWDGNGFKDVTKDVANNGKDVNGNSVAAAG
jgi:hypothetical protein